MRGLFDDQEFTGDGAWRVQWVKMLVGKPIHFTSRSEQPVCASVHFFRRAFLCCGGDDCPACYHQQARPMVYLFGGSPRNTFVLELNLLAWLRFQDQSMVDGRDATASIMDITFKCCRPGVKKTAAVDIVGAAETSFHVDQIDEVHRLRALSRLFSLQMPTRISNVQEAIAVMRLRSAEALTQAIKEAERLAKS